MTTERTRDDVEREIKTKRALLLQSMECLRVQQENVRRVEAHMAVLEAQMVALATEEAEFERQARLANDETPYYLPPIDTAA